MRIAAFAALLMLASCSAGFNHDWKKALAGRSESSPHDPSGPWQGTWRSEVSGHQGELRCIVSRTAASGAADRGNLHRFHYHATFLKTLSATYDVTHEVKKTKEGFSFAGDQTLTGLGGGLYHYEGRGDLRQFSATFRSGTDHGVFELRRP